MGNERDIQVRDLETIRMIRDPPIADIMSTILNAISESRELGKWIELIYIGPELQSRILSNQPIHGHKLHSMYSIKVEICPLIRGLGFIIR